MKLSAPIFRLKRKAKLLARAEKIPLNKALEHIAVDEGYGSWSLLSAHASAPSPAAKLLARLRPGDLMLLGARPGQGKTLMSLELAVEAMRSGSRSIFFTLEYTETNVQDRLRAIGVRSSQFDHLFELDCSDSISADHIMAKLAFALRGTLVIVDYLQLLDQKRGNPELAQQVEALKTFARERGLIFIFISQIDRSYDPAKKPCPDLCDVRLPNPLDLRMFDMACFLNQSVVQVQAAS